MQVLSRGCKSCPEAIWIWLKWKFAIDRFLPLFTTAVRYSASIRFSAPAESRAVVPWTARAASSMRGQSTRGESDDHDHRTPKLSQGRKRCRSIDGCAYRNTGACSGQPAGRSQSDALSSQTDALRSENHHGHLGKGAR